MRLWHIDLIPYLPKSQLLAQWRELNSIFAKEDKHVLINYIYDYPKDDLLHYTNSVLLEMRSRGINIRTMDKMERYFADVQSGPVYRSYQHHHNEQYLTICYMNLLEKHIRGQKDFSAEQFEKLTQFYNMKKEQPK